MNAINVLFSALFAAGLFAVVLALGLREKVDLSELEKLSGSGDASRSSLERLQQRLDTARLGVSAGEFMLISIVLAFLGGGAMYLMSDAPLAAILGFFAGGLVYWIYLNNKAEKALEEYEIALPQVMARLVSGARMGGSFSHAAQHAAEFGPENSREDWQYIYEQIKGGAEPAMVFDVINARRGSLLLGTLFDLMTIQQQRGASLAKTLDGLENSMRDRVRMLRKARTSLKGPLRELQLVCAIPFVAIMLIRIMMPIYAAFYATLSGQLFLLLGWGMTIAGFLWGYVAFSRALREETNFGGLEPEARGRLAPVEERQTARQQQTPSDQPPAAGPGQAPAALRDVLGTAGD